MRRRKRTKNSVNTKIRRTAVAYNPSYCSLTPAALDHCLPTTPSDLLFSRYCAYQQMQDTRDVFLFFRAHWVKNRDGIHIIRNLDTPIPTFSPMVFDITHEDEMQDFHTRIGYDIYWERILELQWHDFVALATHILTRTLEGMIHQPDTKKKDDIILTGDTLWLPKAYRNAIFALSRANKNRNITFPLF